jgi:DNA-binding beta-propeller fold protein YncE
VDGEGHIYVADYTTGRIQVFDNGGSFLRQWHVEGVNDEVYISSMDASQDGIVYVTETGRILAYDGATGDPLGMLTDIDGFSDLFLTEDGEILASMWSCGDRFCRFAPDGTVELDITGAVEEVAGRGELQPLVAADGTGSIFVLGCFTGSIFRFDSDGVYRDMFGSSGTDPGQFGMPSDIAIDGRGYVYVPDAGGIISVFETSGRFLGRIDLPFYDYVYGMDVGPDGNLYLVTGGFEVVSIGPFMD